MTEDSVGSKIFSFLLGLFASVASFVFITILNNACGLHVLNMKWAFFGTLLELFVVLLFLVPLLTLL